MGFWVKNLEKKMKNTVPLLSASGLDFQDTLWQCSSLCNNPCTLSTGAGTKYSSITDTIMQARGTKNAQSKNINTEGKMTK